MFSRTQAVRVCLAISLAWGWGMAVTNNNNSSSNSNSNNINENNNNNNINNNSDDNNNDDNNIITTTTTILHIINNNNSSSNNNNNILQHQFGPDRHGRIQDVTEGSEENETKRGFVSLCLAQEEKKITLTLTDRSGQKSLLPLAFTVAGTLHCEETTCRK